MQEVIGQGLGTKLLHSAINEVALMRRPQAGQPARSEIGQPGRSEGGPARRLTVNTCTADHPRALPNYLAAGFTEMRQGREIWDIPPPAGV